jgi:predicted nucleotidyltransferase component of viral defense system
LSYLYKFSDSEKLLFKGGTALRFIYGSPRFSEDLDFSGFGIKASRVEDLFAKALGEIEKEGIRVEIEEAKKTTGGYLGKNVFQFLDYQASILIEVSLRNRRKIKGVPTLINNDFIPSYTILQLPQEVLVLEKISALFARAKPRDYFDFYFMLRANLLPIKKKEIFQRVLKSLEKEKINFKKELSNLLPRAHHSIIKDFKSNLIREIKRFI